jgi:hypothetical protein
VVVLICCSRLGSARLGSARLAQNQRAIVADQELRNRTLIDKIDAEQGIGGVAVASNIPWGIRKVDVQHALGLLPKDLDLATRNSALLSIFDATSVNGQPRPFWPVRVLQLAVALRVRSADDDDDLATTIARQRIREALLNFPGDPQGAASHRLERVLPVAIARLLTSEVGVDYGEIGHALQQSRNIEWLLRYPLNAHRVAFSHIYGVSTRLWMEMFPWSVEQITAAAEAYEALADTTTYDENFLRQFVGVPFIGDEWRHHDQYAESVAVFIAEEDALDLVDSDAMTALNEVTRGPSM